jgi:small-conductance mechanosensitive channel
VALSVLLGDIRALAGSLGLVGLALSWALQTPIESFTGWLLNSFKGYYRVGDRISVGEVFGDVYRIDFLATTVWEYGGRDNPPGWIDAEQPTGRLITFPNNEILTGPVVNYTRDFPYVWDELTVAVANESDIPYTMEVLRRVGGEEVGEHMREPARQYREILVREGLDTAGIWEEPRVFASLTDWGANLTIRYLVAARQRRLWKSQLAVRVAVTLNHEDHSGRILPIYPRQQIQVIRPDGTPAEVQWFSGDTPWGEAGPQQRRGGEA